MRRLLLLLALAAVIASGLPARAGAASWADDEIRKVVDAGLMGPSAGRFRPAERLTRAELGEILAALTGEERVVLHPDGPVTVAQLDAALVRVLGLGPAAGRFRVAARASGLRPPRRLGTEVAARLLRLRYNHPAERDHLELRPRDAVTRAETAHSLARVLELSASDLAYVNDLAQSFSLPVFTTWQRRVLARAVRFVGFAYVWGGTWESEQVTFGVRSRGGFDCSGFVWRVYKLEPFAGGEALASTLQGRTTYELSAEVPAADRVPFSRLRPGDLVFFGDRGVRSRPAEVGHMGIYVGGGWFVHSSSQGTTLAPLTGWYATSFAWGRRPLAEAGLA